MGPLKGREKEREKRLYDFTRVLKRWSLYREREERDSKVFVATRLKASVTAKRERIISQEGHKLQLKKKEGVTRG